MGRVASLRANLPVLTIVAMLAAGCAHTAPTRFYTLSATAPSGALARAEAGPAVVIAPVHVAAYLDRPQIVIRLNESEVQLGEFDQWAEPLSDGISRVLAENLSRLLPSDRVSESRSAGIEPAGLRVLVSVTGLDRDRNVAVLKARWSVVSGAGRELVADRLFTTRVAVSGGEVASLVSAHSRALAMLSEEIAAVMGATPARSGAN
jgi:uncharacterized lipoprotein YmbA